MIRPYWSKGTIRISITVVLGFLALLAGSRWPSGLLVRPAMAPLKAEDLDALVLHNARMRAWLELSVVLLQAVAVSTLCVNHLFPSTAWARCGRLGFALAMIGLGVVGTLCAGYASEFALFAGGTMAILLNLAILDQSPAPHSQSRTKPVCRSFSSPDASAA